MRDPEAIADTPLELVERAAEMARIDAALRPAAAGSGSLVVVEGPAGIGKSSVLSAAGSRANERGFLVLGAVAGEFERELGFGIVRQLFERTLRASEAPRQDALLAGAAGLARPLLMPSQQGGTSVPAGLMHGLYWLAANLSDERPLALCVDDAQWCDEASLAWLLYLARRLADLPVVLVLAVRSRGRQARGGPLAALADGDLGERIVLAPLSEAGSAYVVRAGWARDADEELCRACFEVTGGNPFLLRELVHAIGGEDPPSGAAVTDRVRALTPRAVTRSVVARLARLPPASGELARGLAILGGRAELRELLALTGLDDTTATPALDALEREQIAAGRPVAFVHPLVGAAVYGDMPVATRSLEHARAARVLDDLDTAAARVASHLLLVEPADDRWAVGVLRRAARDASRDGSPQTAVPWLARALAEPPPKGERGALLHELGAAELLAGPTANGSEESHAEPHLAAAVNETSDPRAQALAALDWGDALWARHRYVDAVAAFDHGIAAVRDTDPELALRIEAHAAAAGRLDLGTCAMVSRRLQRFGDAPQQTPATGLIAGVLAIDHVLAGEPAPQVIALAERMLDGGRLPGGHFGAQIPLFAINALLYCDQADSSRQLLDDMIAGARASGTVRGVVIALCWRGLIAHRTGALAEAAGDLATAVEISAARGPTPMIVTDALLAEVLLDRGGLQAAVNALAAVEAPAELPGYMGWNYFLYARGAISAAQRNFAGALDDFLACGERQERWGAHNPSVLAWRSQAALMHQALGERDAARKLADEELRLARRFGTPRATGIALRALGLIEHGERQIELLREALDTLEDSDATLERAQTLCELGGALRRSNQRAAARAPLRQALEIATRCGAAPLAGRAREELLATGARPRKLMLAGVEALTPIERQAAGMAAQGLSNPQIAQALFISRKTVEKRLTEVYRKLDIASRNELADALGQPVDV